MLISQLRHCGSWCGTQIALKRSGLTLVNEFNLPFHMDRNCQFPVISIALHSSSCSVYVIPPWFQTTSRKTLETFSWRMPRQLFFLFTFAVAKVLVTHSPHGLNFLMKQDALHCLLPRLWLFSKVSERTPSHGGQWHSDCLWRLGIFWSMFQFYSCLMVCEYCWCPQCSVLLAVSPENPWLTDSCLWG